MKIQLGLLATFCAVAALAYNPPSVTPTVALDMNATGSVVRPDLERFEAKLAGSGARCGLTRLKRGMNGLHGVEASPDCRAILTGLADVRLWRENADGSVSLLDAHRRPVMEFGTGDGVDYESFRPLRPLVALDRVD